jgi:hypothetical protein
MVVRAKAEGRRDNERRRIQAAWAPRTTPAPALAARRTRAGVPMERQRNPHHPPPTDEEIREIAAEIRRAMRHPREDSRDGICSSARELPPADEDRVIIAIAVLELLESLPRA